MLNLDYEQLLADAQEVLDTLKPKEREVPTIDQNWIQVRIIPLSHRGERD